MGAAWVEQATAARNQLGDMGPAGELSLGLTMFDIVVVSAEIGGNSPADHAKFTQTVMPVNGGNSGDASSGVSITGSRSIADCIDCRTDDLVITGGTFWRVGFDLAASSIVYGGRLPINYALGVIYQRYASGAAIAQELRLGFTCWLF